VSPGNIVGVADFSVAEGAELWHFRIFCSRISTPTPILFCFGISEYYRPIPELDEWLRRRIRMCYWKQWRWPRTKISHLLALGVSLKTAIQHGVSSKSYWHMARTPAMQQALNNDWLQGQGVPNIKQLWCKAQGYSS